MYGVGQNSGSTKGRLGLGDEVDRNVYTLTMGTGWKQCSLGN